MTRKSPSGFDSEGDFCVSGGMRGEAYASSAGIRLLIYGRLPDRTSS